jgi:hypothetical protein
MAGGTDNKSQVESGLLFASRARFDALFQSMLHPTFQGELCPAAPDESSQTAARSNSRALSPSPSATSN